MVWEDKGIGNSGPWTYSPPYKGGIISEGIFKGASMLGKNSCLNPKKGYFVAVRKDARHLAKWFGSFVWR